MKEVASKHVLKLKVRCSNACVWEMPVTESSARSNPQMGPSMTTCGNSRDAAEKIPSDHFAAAIVPGHKIDFSSECR